MLWKCNRLWFKPPEWYLKAVFSIRGWQLQKAGKVLSSFHGSIWLYKMSFKVICLLFAVLFVIPLNSAKQIVKPGRSSWTHRRVDWTKWWKGRSTNFESSRSFIFNHSQGNGNLYSDITCSWAWTKVFYICTVWHSKFCLHKLYIRKP